ncbi:MAG: alpha-amylase family glycosyl hydrolase [Pseudomonadota bacterium]
MKSTITAGLLCAALAGCAQDKNDAPASASAEAPGDELLLHVPSPDWRDQVIYFLMLDRFDDGDPSNNDQGANEYDPTKESHYSGGDIQGVIDRLDYIQGLGATAVWTTPQVANQWWSNAENYGGYHGYWATDFSDVDAHNGTMDTWKQLSDNLHRRGMYLVQDIVVNHTGIFYNYDGEYDPEDTSKNFVLLEAPDSLQPAPTQAPFHMINRLDPEHAAADIYHWTPTITDYSILEHQFTYQLASLADINTSNPVAIDALKKTYGDWIRNTGVDAFRIDTVRYVEPEFFRSFTHDADGINAAASETGRDDFLMFGEVFDTSLPFANQGEEALAVFLGTDDDPILPSVINFPMFAELNQVFGQGRPTAQLAYRLEQHMAMMRDPWRTPHFIDNHDTSRFLAGGNATGLKQALTAIFTIPGIPIVYQGTGQMHTESRKAMFGGGFETEEDQFDTTAPMYLFLSQLADLRKSDKALTRGTIDVLGSEANGPGLVAWTRSHEGRTVLVMMNTATHPILVGNLPIAEGPVSLEPKMLGGVAALRPSDQTGAWSGDLPPGSIAIAELIASEASETTDTATVEAPTISPGLDGAELIANTTVRGTAPAGATVSLVMDGNLYRVVNVPADDNGNWSWQLPVRDLGRQTARLEAYDVSSGAVSEAAHFEMVVAAPSWERRWEDPTGDATGPDGNYKALTHEASTGQIDITGAQVRVGGATLELTLSVANLTDAWLPPNGFDNVAFTSFIHVPGREGATVLPQIHAEMPEGLDWSIGHVAYGWGNYAFGPEGATAEEAPRKYPVAPNVKADKEAKTITFTFRGRDYGIEDWTGAKLYITTWDITGEGYYRHLSPEGGAWDFGGGEEDGPKIMDQMLLTVGVD